MLKVWAAALALLVTAGMAHAERRVALVVGISTYEHLPALASPVNDARLVADALRQAGFDVTPALDVDHSAMRAAVRLFAGELKASGEGTVGLFYYSGHSIQIEGRNYLVPRDAKLDSEADIEFEAVPASLIVSVLEAPASEPRIVILDAGRRSPLQARSRSSARGLARMSVPPGMIIAYANEPGQVAMDGDGANAPYATALAEGIHSPDLDVITMFKKVRGSVLRATDGRQKPWTEFSRAQALRLWDAPSVTTAVAQDGKPGGHAEDAEIWNRIRDSNDTAALREYLSRYPDGAFAEIARRRIAILSALRSRPQTTRRAHGYNIVGKSGAAASAPVASAELEDRLRVARLRQQLATVSAAQEPAQAAPPSSTGAPAAAPEPERATMPEFPWPPPAPSVQIRLPREPFADATDLTTVSERLIAPLRKAGYWEYSLYHAPNGFALVTRLERINEDGSPVSESVRYRLPDDGEPFSLAAYIRRLFFASPGYYRLIVFIVTDRPFMASGDPIREREALGLLRGGANALPSEYGEMEFDASYGIDALIYEFRKPSGATQANFVMPGRLSALIHLKKSGLSSAFGLLRD